MLKTIPKFTYQFTLFALLVFLSPALTAQGICTLDAGELNTPSGSVYIPVCLDDMDEGLTEIIRTGFVGAISQYVVTTPSGFILEVLDGNPPFDLRNYGARNLAVWSISYTGTLTDFDINDNICSTSATECFNLSNPILLNRQSGDGCDIFCNSNAGNISLPDGSGTVVQCIGDDGGDNRVSIALDGTASGDNLAFAITNSQGTIIDLPSGNGPFNFSNFGSGTFLIWYVSFADVATGIAIGNGADNIRGCFSISNPVTVIRERVEGGILSLVDGGTDLTICAGDGVSDAFNVTLTDTVGSNFTYVVTDGDGIVLGTPANQPFDLEGAGGGACNIYALTSSSDFSGVTVGGDIADFTGCFSLSNPITVLRLTGDDCNGANEFTANLSGLNELPCPVTTTGQGALNASLDGNILTVTGAFSGLTSDFDPNVAGGAHLHTGLAGQNGGISVRLVTAIDADLRGGRFLAADNVFELTDDQVAALRARGIYVNIHTLDFGGGELRGQLVPAGADDYKVAYLLGVNEVPAVVTTAMGSAVIERTGNRITVSGGFSGLGGPIATQIAGGAHLHLGIAGRNGPVLFPLSMDISDDMTAATFPANSNTFILNSNQLAALDDEMIYVNVHSADVLSGELRGQVTSMSTSQFYANPSGHQARPVSVNTTGNGRLVINWDGDETITVSGSVNDLMSPLDVNIAGGSHIHLGLPGRSGDVVFVLDVDLDDDGLGGVWLPSENTFTLTPAQLETLFNRGYYVNVHTEDFASGEVRGQVMNLAKGYFGANMAGINANPEAIKSDGAGFFLFDWCGDQVTAVGSFNDLRSDFDANVAGGIHVHAGDADGTGGIVFPLNGDIDANLRNGVFQAADNVFTIDAATQAAFANGGLYINIHTTRNPSGEIRGQILRDDNAFPEASEIISPEDGAVVTVFPSGSDLEDGLFFTADDPDGDLVVYTIEIAGELDEEFSEIIACQKVGTDTLSNATIEAVYDTLIAFGARPGLTVPLRYRIVSSDGSVSTRGGSRSITLVIGEDPVCVADGGVLSLMNGVTEFTICAGDGQPDPFNVILTDTVGAEFTYLVVSDAGEILGVPANQPFDFDGAGGGACTLYAVSHDGTLSGAVMGGSFADLGGCFDLSNPVVVTRNVGSDCDNDCNVDGGFLLLAVGDSGGETETTICAGDGIPDPFNVLLRDTVGAAFTYLVVSDQGEILGVPDNQPFDFDGAGGGACTLYAVSHDGSLSGAVTGGRFADLGGCFDLSNPVVVNRQTGAECDNDCVADGGVLSLMNGVTEFTICAGDGQPDPFNVILTDTVGAEFTYLVVSDAGEILGVPANQPFDFDGAGGGACTLYAVSHDGTLSGAVMGGSFADLGGCFDLSNPVVVTRNVGSDCDNDCNVDGGFLLLAVGDSGGETETTICAGDGIPDPFNVLLRDTVGAAFTYLVVSDQGEILGVPDNQPFDFDGAGGGACTLYAVSHDGSLSGAVTGGRFADLGGCFDLSNPVVVNRQTGAECGNDCVADGGVLSRPDGTTSFTICAGDGQPDPFDVTLSDTIGAEFTYLVVSDAGVILGVPANQPFDFDGAGGGACTLYAVSHDGTLSGAVMGGMFADLGGCFDLSNPVVVTRLAGDDCDDFCDADGGLLELEDGSTDFTICAGDGVADPFNVVLTDTSGAAFTYLVVSDAGEILGVPANQPFDFDGAGGGACTLYAVSHDGTLTGAVTGGLFDDLGGCFDLSNPIVVTRNVGDECNDDCNVDGGVLSLSNGTTSFTICAGDGEPDPFNVELTDTMGAEFTYLVVSDQGVILGVPANQPFDFDGAGGGACTLYAVSHDGTLSGAVMGGMFDDLGGCFDLSNPMVVTRLTGAQCDPGCTADGGILELADGGTAFSICAGDGQPDPFNVIVTDTSGAEFTYLVVSDAGEILGVPANQPFDFDGAGGGACTLYAVSHDGSLSGAVMGGAFADLGGCFDLSNPVVVTRATGDDCNGTGFTASISGLNEMPCPVTTTGNGSLTATLFGNTLTVSGEFSDLTSDFDADVAGGAHLHAGMAGQNGGIAFLLTTDLDDDLRGGRFLAADNVFQLSNQQVALLQARGLYVNIHTTDFGGGELRGQLVPGGASGYKVAYLSGANEVPAVVSPAGGSVIVERNGNTITLSGSFSGLTGTIATEILGGAHIHTGLAGRNGPVAFPLNLEINGDSTAATLMADDNVFVLNAAQLAALDNDMLYVNVHSSAVLSGELRGQLTDVGVSQFYSNPSGHQARPVAINTPGNSRLLINLVGDSTITVSGSVSDLRDTVSTAIAGGAHIHLGLPGTSGPVVFPLSITLDDDSLGGAWLPADNTFNLDSAELAALFSRELYVNIHSGFSQSGEIRGQVMNLAKGYYGSNLAGINANPVAIKTTGSGFMMYELCDDELVATGSFADLDSAFDPNVAGGSHLHLGAADEVGGVQFILDAEVDDEGLSGLYRAADNAFTVDSNGLAALVEGSLYFNLHTVDNASGEIRGQVLRDDNAFPEAAEILTPEDGATVTVFEGGSSLEDGFFTSADDPDGDVVVYTIEIAGELDPEFTEIVACQKVGTDTLSDATLDVIYGTLVDFGLRPGFTLSLLYRVVASDGSVSTPGGFRTITLILGEGPCDAVSGGNLSLAGGGNELTICAGDGIDDDFNVTLTDTVGTNFTYVITDGNGMVLGVPANQPFNLEGAGGGNCNIYALSFEDDFGGVAVGDSLSDFTGCFDLSDPVTVIRQTGDDCETGLVGINEIDERGMVELTNLSNISVNAGNLFLSSNDQVVRVNTLALECGSFFLKPGDQVTVDASSLLTIAGDELALSVSTTPDATDMLMSYVAWGSSERMMEDMAVIAGIWFADTQLGAPEAIVSLQRIPTISFPTYALGAPTPCAENTLTTSTNQPAADRVEVYPNPVGDRLTVELTGLRAAETQLQLLDFAGRVMNTRVLEMTNGRFEINTSALPSGAYLLRLTNDAGVSTARIIRQ